MSPDLYKVKNSLLIKNPQFLKYGKVKGMYLLKKYLPEMNLISNVTIIESEEQWNKIKDSLPERITVRTDNIIGEETVKIEGTSGKKDDVLMALKQIKQQNPNAVILLLEGKIPAYPRYKNLGGFTVAFDVNESIEIGLVGKGFDGRELTRGIAIHENYKIPWNEVLWINNKLDLLKNRFVEKSLIQNKDYLKSRDVRIEFLTSELKEQYNIVNKSIPRTYTEIDDSIIENILNNIIIPLYSKKTELQYDCVTHFKVQGNISEDGKLIPFEIFTPERIDKTQKKQYEKGE